MSAHKRKKRIDGVRTSQRSRSRSIPSTSVKKSEDTRQLAQSRSQKKPRQPVGSVQSSRIAQSPRLFSQNSQSNIQPPSNSNHRQQRVIPISRQRSRPWRQVWGIARFILPVVAALFFVGYMLQQFATALITVTPYRIAVSLDQEDVSAVRFPGQDELSFAVMVVEERAVVSVDPDQEIATESTASGPVRLFNNFSTSPQRLAPGTRIRAVDGKEFLIGTEAVIIPGKQGETPGEILTTVYAATPGPESNIDPTDFSIPQFLEQGLSDRYEGIYGISTQAFTGGFRGTRPSISDEAIASLEADLTRDISDLLRERVSVEKTQDMLVVDNSLTLIVDEPVFIPNRDTDTGTLELQAHMYALLVDRDDLSNHLASVVISDDHRESERLRFIPDTNFSLQRIGVDGLEPINYETDKEIRLRISGDGVFVAESDEQEIIDAFLGMPYDDGEMIVRQQPYFGTVTIKRRPFWSKTFPGNPKDIHVDIRDQ